MSSRGNFDPALKNLSFLAEAKMKIGIVGRTGPGKSTILQTLFRLIEFSAGKIEIDGINIRELGLHILRKNIAYIP